MTTIVNNPAPASTDSGSNGFIITILVLFFVALIFYFFGIPVIRNLVTPQINIPAPIINLPNKIDVNVKQTP